MTPQDATSPGDSRRRLLKGAAVYFALALALGAATTAAAWTSVSHRFAISMGLFILGECAAVALLGALAANRAARIRRGRMENWAELDAYPERLDPRWAPPDYPPPDLTLRDF